MIYRYLSILLTIFLTPSINSHNDKNLEFTIKTHEYGTIDDYEYEYVEDFFDNCLLGVTQYDCNGVPFTEL